MDTIQSNLIFLIWLGNGIRSNLENELWGVSCHASKQLRTVGLAVAV